MTDGWFDLGEVVAFMGKGSSGGSGAHESGKSSDGKGKDGYTGKHEAPAKGGGGKK